MDEQTWIEVRDGLITKLQSINYNTVLTDQQIENAFMDIGKIAKFDFDSIFVKIDQDKYGLLFGMKKLWEDENLYSNLNDSFENLKSVVIKHFSKPDDDLIVLASQAIRFDPVKRAEIESILT